MQSVLSAVTHLALNSLGLAFSSYDSGGRRGKRVVFHVCVSLAIDNPDTIILTCKAALYGRWYLTQLSS